jgi:hypothetical protein
MNRADKMYAALKHGGPMTRRDLFEHAGCFYLSNNAASELRARGVEVVQWRADGQYVYQLLPPLGEVRGFSGRERQPVREPLSTAVGHAQPRTSPSGREEPASMGELDGFRLNATAQASVGVRGPSSRQLTLGEAL